MSMFRNLLISKNNLPYQKLEYIKSTGTQYIDTDVFYKNTIGISLDFSVNEIPSKFLAGVSVNSQYRFYPFVNTNNTNVVTYAWKSQSAISIEEEFEILVKYNVKLNYENSRNYIWNNTNSVALDGNNIDGDEYDDNIFLFAFNNSRVLSPTFYFKGNIYLTKITDNSELIRDFIPVKLKKALTGTESYYNGRTTNIGQTIGMWDLIENKFYGSETTTNFISEE